MTLTDVIGYLASGLVLVTFCMRTMVPLRVIAICSNVAFMTYGYLAALDPVLLLHLVLLPMNVVRLGQALGWRVRWRAPVEIDIGRGADAGGIGRHLRVVGRGRQALKDTGVAIPDGTDQCTGTHCAGRGEPLAANIRLGQ